MDKEKLRVAVKEKLKSEKKSLRKAAAEIGLSEEHIQRIAEGGRLGSPPQIAALLGWLNKQGVDFE